MSTFQLLSHYTLGCAVPDHPPGRTLELEDLFMEVPGAKGALRVEERRRRRRQGSWLSRGTTDSPVGGFAAIGVQAWSWGVPGMEAK